MADFTQAELDRAAERVREMSRRANMQAGRHTRPAVPDEKEKPPPKAVAPRKNAVNSLLKMINFKGLDMDGDISLILGILLLLSGETTDELLVMALLYIMM